MKKLSVILLFVILVSCNKTDLLQDVSTERFGINEAKELIEADISNCSFPKMFSHNMQTKGDSNAGYIIQWHLYNYRENRDIQIFEIPLCFNCNLDIAFIRLNNSELNIDDTNRPLIQSQLIIKRCKYTKKIIYFINTMIGYSEIECLKEKAVTYFSDKSDFRGYQIFSDTEGNYLPHSYYYENGLVQKMKLYNGYKDSDTSCIRIAIHECDLNTKGSISGSGIYGVCTGCGAFLLDERTCIICGEPVQWPGGGDDGSIGGGSAPCPHCNMSPCICEPCLRCGYDPCVCLGPDEGCQYCYSKECQGECRD